VLYRNTSHPGTSYQRSSRQRVVTPEIAAPDIVTPEVAAPEVAAPEIAEPEIAEPEIAEPEILLSEDRLPSADDTASMASSRQVPTMPGSERSSGGPDLAEVPQTPLRRRPLLTRAGRDAPSRPPRAGRWWAAAAWVGACAALFAIFLRISFSVPMDSDGANNALQAWDMLHGNVLLHGWILGDATFYTFELPLYAVIEIFAGLHTAVAHIGSAITYMIVAACAMAVAVTGSRGSSRAIRSAVVVAIMGAGLLTSIGVSQLLEEPDHIGTAAFLLVTFLLIDRAPDRRFTPPLLCAILCAGQISDATVLLVAVPAVVLVGGYRAVAARRIRTGDVAIVIAAALSVALASLVRRVMVHFGAYTMIQPKTGIAVPAYWPRNAGYTLQGIRALYGAVRIPGSPLGILGAAFGAACLLAAIFGFGKVIWTWRKASRAEQLLCVAIVVNIAAYTFSTFPDGGNYREVIGVLPLGAVLAARALVPDRIVGSQRAPVAVVAAALAALAALLPLAGAATVPAAATPPAAVLSAWLEAHGLTYGIAAYWDASAVSVVSGNRVQVRAVELTHHRINIRAWENKPEWYDAAQHDATFVIGDIGPSVNAHISASRFEALLGRPEAIYKVAGRRVLIYGRNMLNGLPWEIGWPDGKS
jgi:hypothetical protein